MRLKKKKGQSLMLDELIAVLEKLYTEGIDVSKIRTMKYYNKLLLIDVVPKEVIEKLGLQETFPIGMRLRVAINAYRKNITYSITEEHKKKLEEFGLTQEKTIIEKLNEILQVLETIGIETDEIPETRMINGSLTKIRLKHIVGEEQIKEYDLDPEYNIGLSIGYAKKACKKGSWISVSNEEKRQLEEFGIIQKDGKKVRKKSSLPIIKLIEILEILKKEEISLEGIQLSKKINGKQEYIILKELVSNDIIKKYNLDERYKIGHKIAEARLSYRGLGTKFVTDEDKTKLDNLGVITELCKREKDQKELRKKQREALLLYDNLSTPWIK